jgi:hypothetical protein
MTLNVCGSETGSFRIRTAVKPALDPLKLGMSIVWRDRQTFQVHRNIRLEVGRPAMFLLQIRTDDPIVPTLRARSCVVAISRVTDHEEGERAL